MNCGHFLYLMQRLSLVDVALIPYKAVFLVQHFLGCFEY